MTPTARSMKPLPIMFFAAGEPKAQPRPRAFSRNGLVRVYDPSTAEGWKSAIAEAARPHIPLLPIEGPVRVNIVFLFQRPKRLMRKRDPAGRIPHPARPDRDNLDKAVLDTLTRLEIIKDDAQVCAGEISKYYVSLKEKPGAHILIERAI